MARQEEFLNEYRRAVAAFVQAIERAESRCRAACGETGRSGTAFEAIVEVLRSRSWATVAELSAQTGLAEGAVRQALYANMDHFERHSMSPRRVRWRLKTEKSVLTHETDLVGA